MLSGLDLKATIDYTLKNDVDPKTVFKLGVIPSYLFARLSGEGNKDIETAYKILQLTIKGWENFDVPFETVKEKVYDRELEVVPISVLERLPLRVVTELSVKAMELNQLTEAERKN